MDKTSDLSRVKKNSAKDNGAMEEHLKFLTGTYQGHLQRLFTQIFAYISRKSKVQILKLEAHSSTNYSQNFEAKIQNWGGGGDSWVVKSTPVGNVPPKNYFF